MKEDIEQLRRKATEKRWITFLEWINYLSPWNFWVDRNDKSKGLKPHIIDKLSELEQAVSEETRQKALEILKNEIAKADKYEIVPLERVRIKLIQMSSEPN